MTVVPKCVSFAGMVGKVTGFMLTSWSPRMIVLERSSESLEFILPRENPMDAESSDGLRYLPAVQ